jgi:hypothetical protein
MTRGEIISSFFVLRHSDEDLHEYLQGCVTELVFNLDEVGISDCEDRKTNKVIALAAMFDQAIHHGVSRNV